MVLNTDCSAGYVVLNAATFISGGEWDGLKEGWVVMSHFHIPIFVCDLSFPSSFPFHFVGGISVLFRNIFFKLALGPWFD